MKLNLIKALLPALFFTQITLAEEVVNFYNWADYIGESTIRDFEKEYGIKVNYDEYDSSEIVEAKLLDNVKDRTILVFHKRRRKNSRKKNGHRQQYSLIRINKIFSKDGKLLSEAEKLIKPLKKKEVKKEIQEKK